MFFPIAAADWSQALGRIRRLRHDGNWTRIGSNDLYWSAPFFAALVDEIDSLLLEKPETAFKMSTEAILVGERIRAADCPGGDELGKRSLRAWAHAVHGSSCRACERYPEAESVFQQALGLVKRHVLHWAAAEVWRRYAAYLLFRGSKAGIAFVDKALDAYTGFPFAQADALVLRGLFSQYLERDLAAAVGAISRGLELVEPKRSPREASSWDIALHNLMVIYVQGPSDLATIEVALKRIRGVMQRLSRHEPQRRKACTWVKCLMLAHLGATKQAARLLTKAADWFWREKDYHSALVCTVDLARLHHQNGDEALAQETVATLLTGTAAAEPWLKTYVDHHVAAFRRTAPSEESFALLREALFAITRVRPAGVQPCGIMDGTISGSSTKASADGSSTVSGA